MARTADLHIRIDPETKTGAEQLLADVGITITDAIIIFLRQMVYQRKMPFEISVPAHKQDDTDSIYLTMADPSKAPVLGEMKGLIKMSPDFDEPLEEMMEYMY